MNPWLSIPADDYMRHMEHELVAQGELLRDHFAECLARVCPQTLLFLGAGVGNGLSGPGLTTVREIVAVDVNPDYLKILAKQYSHLPLKTICCSFPEQFALDMRFDLVYGALFFEYADLHQSLECIARHLSPRGQLIALLQQPSPKGNITNTGVESLHALRQVMTIHQPNRFIESAEKVGLKLVSQNRLFKMSKAFAEVTLVRPASGDIHER